MTHSRANGYLRAGGILITALTLTTCVSKIEPAAEETPHGWQALFDGKSLTGWDVSSFGGEGAVRVNEECIILGSGETLTGVRWTGEFPKTDYEVMLEAQRLQGSDFFCGMTFPVGEAFCSLIVGGWAGSVIGLSNIDGNDASENETTLVRRLEDKRWYEIWLQVTSPRVRVWIDGEKLIDLDPRGKRLEVRPEVRLSRPFGFASWQTTAALRKILLKYPITAALPGQE